MFEPLPIRILAGIAFIVHGLPKFQDALLAVLIGLLEVIGGILLLVGVVTRITAALFVIEMIGVTLIVKISKALREDMN